MIEVQGNGNIVSIEKQVSSFLRLHLATTGLVEMIQSNEEKVAISCDENLADYFDVVNSGRTLYVSAEGKLRTPKFTQCHIKVYFRQLDALAVRSDGGDVTCPDLTISGPLDLKIQSEGNTTLNINAASIKLLNQCEGNVVITGKCNSITIKNQSEGNFSSKGLIADELTLKNSAEGNVDVYADKAITISHSGEGYIHYYGNAVLKDVKQYGDGEIKHFD